MVHLKRRSFVLVTSGILENVLLYYNVYRCQILPCLSSSNGLQVNITNGIIIPLYCQLDYYINLFYYVNKHTTN